MNNFMSKGKRSIQGGTNLMIKDRQTKSTKKKMSLQMDWSKEEV